jgi:hypothetical protein
MLDKHTADYVLQENKFHLLERAGLVWFSRIKKKNALFRINWLELEWFCTQQFNSLHVPSHAAESLAGKDLVLKARQWVYKKGWSITNIIQPQHHSTNKPSSSLNWSLHWNPQTQSPIKLIFSSWKYTQWSSRLVSFSLPFWRLSWLSPTESLLPRCATRRRAKSVTSRNVPLPLVVA